MLLMMTHPPTQPPPNYLNLTPEPQLRWGKNLAA